MEKELNVLEAVRCEEVVKNTKKRTWSFTAVKKKKGKKYEHGGSLLQLPSDFRTSM